MSDKNKKQAKKPANAYMQYSGMAFELVAFLLVGVFLGGKIDAWLELSVPYATAGLLILFLIGYFMRVYYTLVK